MKNDYNPESIKRKEVTRKMYEKLPAEIKENADNLEAITETMTEMQGKLEASFKSMEDFLHTDNVKVYRNVQAAMIEELEKQTAEIKHRKRQLQVIS